jgi:hypothetical protein
MFRSIGAYNNEMRQSVVIRNNKNFERLPQNANEQMNPEKLAEIEIRRQQEATQEGVIGG